MHPRNRAALRTGAVPVAFGILGAMLLWPLPRYFRSAIPGDGFDGWQNLWNLWWIRRSLLELGCSPWFTPLLDYPNGASLLFHTLNFPNGLLALPVYEALGPYAAYNFIVVFSFAAGGLGAVLLALRLLGRRGYPAALFAGCAFAFSPFHIAHLLGHMQVFAFQWLPCAVLGAVWLWEGAPAPEGTALRQQRTRLLLGALFGALAALVDWYNLIYLCLFWAVYGIWQFLHLARASWRKACRAAAFAALQPLGMLAVCAPLLVPMVQEALRADYMQPGQGEALALSADLLAYFVPQEMHPLWGRFAARLLDFWPVSTAERMIYLGAVPTALAILGWRRGSLRVRPFVWVALVFFLLSLGPALRIGGKVIAFLGQPLPMPYAWLARAFPWLEIARSLSRYSVMVLLAVALLAAAGLKALCPSRRRAWWGTLLACGLTLFEFFPAPYPFSPPDVPEWYRSLPPGRGAILNLPVTWDRPRYLLYQMAHGRPLVAGYISRRNPRAPAELYPGLQHLRSLGGDVLPLPDAPTFASIAADLGIEYVVLDHYQMAGREREETLRLVRLLLPGQLLAYEDDRLEVYRIAPPGRRSSYVALYGEWGGLERWGEELLGRRAYPKSGLLLQPAQGCTLTVSVVCDAGRSGTVFSSEREAILLREIVPGCGKLVGVTWSEDCAEAARG